MNVDFSTVVFCGPIDANAQSGGWPGCIRVQVNLCIEVAIRYGRSAITHFCKCAYVDGLVRVNEVGRAELLRARWA